MATRIPQRDLRNHPGDVLQRVERGEALTITVKGRPVADLVPTRESDRKEIAYDDFIAGIGGLLRSDDTLLEEIQADDHELADPFRD